jgi:hypothetical protein
MKSSELLLHISGSPTSQELARIFGTAMARDFARGLFNAYLES